MKQKALSWLRSETKLIAAKQRRLPSPWPALVGEEGLFVEVGSSRADVGGRRHQAFQLSGFAIPFPGAKSETRMDVDFQSATFRPLRHTLRPGGGASFPGKVLLFCS